MDKDRLPLLLLKASLERQQVANDLIRLKKSMDPEAFSTQLKDLGVQAVSNALPSMPRLFNYLGKYPVLSLNIAKALLQVASQARWLPRTFALGVASWFVYHRFQKDNKLKSE